MDRRPPCYLGLIYNIWQSAYLAYLAWNSQLFNLSDNEFVLIVQGLMASIPHTGLHMMDLIRSHDDITILKITFVYLLLRLGFIFYTLLDSTVARSIRPSITKCMVYLWFGCLLSYSIGALTPAYIFGL